MTGGFALAGDELFNLIIDHFNKQSWTIMKPSVC